MVYHLKYFRNYLWGRNVQVRTDHGALRWYKNFRQPDYQLSSWIETVEEFGVEIVTRPGSWHSNADALSRLPLCTGKKCICEECVEKSNKFVDIATNTENDSVCKVLDNRPCFVSAIAIESELTALEISEEQKSDPGIAKIFQLKLKGAPHPCYQDISQLGSEVKCYWAEWDRIVLKNGILYRRWESPSASEICWQIILPRKFRNQVLSSIHEKSGHLGQRRCYIALRRRFFWFKNREDLNRWIKTWIFVNVTKHRHGVIRQIYRHISQGPLWTE